jgi:hypothetical protein
MHGYVDKAAYEDGEASGAQTTLRAQYEYGYSTIQVGYTTRGITAIEHANLS